MHHWCTKCCSCLSSSLQLIVLDLKVLLPLLTCAEEVQETRCMNIYLLAWLLLLLGNKIHFRETSFPFLVSTVAVIPHCGSRLNQWKTVIPYGDKFWVECSNAKQHLSYLDSLCSAFYLTV
jgi:hypothetical protein